MRYRLVVAGTEVLAKRPRSFFRRLPRVRKLRRKKNPVRDRLKEKLKNKMVLNPLTGKKVKLRSFKTPMSLKTQRTKTPTQRQVHERFHKQYKKEAEKILKRLKGLAGKRNSTKQRRKRKKPYRKPKRSSRRNRRIKRTGSFHPLLGKVIA